jgi:hypothetical protein
MRPLLTTLLVAAILINLVISSVNADARDMARHEQLAGLNSYQTYVPSLLR